MTKKEVRYSRETIQCNHCGNIAPMQIVGNCDDTIEGGGENDPPFEHGDVYEVLKCPACNEATIRRYFWHDGMDPEDEVNYEVLYPSPKKIPVGLPAHIHKALLASNKVRNVDANAYGVLIRRLLELVCIDRNAMGKTLNDQLKDLSSKGEIPVNLVDVSHKLRILGNIGAHAGSGELSMEDLSILSTLANAVLEYVYSAPHYAQLAQAAVSKKKS